LLRGTRFAVQSDRIVSFAPFSIRKFKMDTPQPVVSLADTLHLFRDHPWRWMVPTVAVFLAATVYAAVRARQWDVSQAMIVRNEAISQSERQQPGKFERVDQMKTVQETILELVRSRGVLEAAMRELGPPADAEDAGAWPTQLDVAETRETIALAPPKGGVFGATEVFYLKVKDRDQARAVRFVQAICRHLQLKSQELRNAKAKSMVAELENAVAIAKNDLNDATRRLTEQEGLVAADLSELRMLQTAPSGDSELRRRRVALETELRAAHESLRMYEEMKLLLVEALEHPTRIVATPSSLLALQPALSQLKVGLVEAQLRTAQLKGRFRDEHPQVVAARSAETEIEFQLRGELDDAIRGIEVDLRLTATRVETLENELAETDQRLEQLAFVRAQYGNTLREIEHMTKILETGQQNLAEARASGAASRASSLLTLIGKPEISPKPVGPGTLMIILGGLVGGFLVGAGVLFLTVPQQTGRAVRFGEAPRSGCDRRQRRRTVSTALDQIKEEREVWAQARL
jgi:uncharacterized protein involved in exopolysaccharide biosynthesis